jgi:hypothetical protein
MRSKGDEYGGPLPLNSPDREALIGMAEIERYSGFTELVLKRLAKQQGFPMCLLETKWVSSKRRVDEWFYRYVGQQNEENRP